MALWKEFLEVKGLFLTMNRIKRVAFCLILASFLIVPTSAQRPEAFSKEKPLRLDFDMENIEQPKAIGTGYLYDFIDGTIFQPTRRNLDLPRTIRAIAGKKKESINVNTWDEVPNSSWFTNRLGFREMSVDEIRNGPNKNPKPKAGKLVILRGKTVGATPGFWVRDENGQTFVLKFDPKSNPELASGAEIIATKMFWAFGYNVPENQLFSFRREDLEISDDATVTGEKNKKSKMTNADVNTILDKIAKRDDGSYRVLASRLISGVPLGGFTFSGRRKDDPNDYIPHEIRRDVRGLKVFAAWMEHNDLRVGNTFDLYVEEDGRKFVRHHLIDFGSTLGSDSVGVNLPEVGREHGLDFSQAGKILASGGTYQPPWRSKNHDPVFSPAVGRYSTKNFGPNRWKSNFPLVALREMTSLDGFWAMQIVSAFTPEHIRAVVETAEFSKKSDTDYLIREIIARQKIIVQHYANKRMGAGKFVLSSVEGKTSLGFKDYRLRFPSDSSVNRQIEYRIESVGKKSVTLGSGRASGNRIKMDAGMTQKISTAGSSGKNRGVVKLTMNRVGEKGKKAIVYLWSKDGSNLEVAGIIH